MTCGLPWLAMGGALLMMASPAWAFDAVEDSASTTEQPLEPSSDYTGPVLLVESHPDYPAELREAGVQGDVLLQISLDETGRPFGIEVLDSPHPRLSELASRAARKLVFAPASLGVEPLPARLQYRYTFSAEAPEHRKKINKVKQTNEGTPVVADSVLVVDAAYAPSRVA